MHPAQREKARLRSFTQGTPCDRWRFGLYQDYLIVTDLFWWLGSGGGSEGPEMTE